MKTVLIVDDEQTIRQGMEYLIDWEEYGFTIVATAENGLQGLDYIKQYEPDLVITDIRMPVKDGLEMIREAKELFYHEFYSIILSGYSDFEYAQKAIKLGFASYLLKPIEEEELIEILKKINHQLLQTEETVLQHALLDKLFGNDHTGLKQYRKINCCRFDGKIPEAVLKKLDIVQCRYVQLSNLGQEYIILLDERDLNDLNSQFVQVFSNVGKIISSGWQDANQDLTHLTSLLNELESQSYLWPDQLIWPQGICRQRAKTQEKKEDILQQLLSQVLSSQPIHETITRYKQVMVADNLSKEELIWTTQQDFTSIVKQVKDKLQKNLEVDEIAFLESIRKSPSYPAMLIALEEKLSELSDITALEFNNINIIEQVLYYINYHYDQDLTLKEVADHFGYNSAYLGKKFKKQMGLSFLTYLEKIRMTKASEFLRETNLMVYEVADKVGYKNIDYFYKKFKQFYNISPNEYRKNKST